MFKLNAAIKNEVVDLSSDLNNEALRGVLDDKLYFSVDLT